MRPYDLDCLKRAIELAGCARERGNGPFGALLVDADGRVLLEAENTVMTEQDCTGHAERNLIRLASALPREVLAGCTLYTSTEPCVMCAGAIYAAGINRVVFGLTERGMVALFTHMSPDDFLDLPCREVFRCGARPVEVVGPLLEEEARRVHLGFW